MKILLQPDVLWLCAGILGLLAIATIVGLVLGAIARSEKTRATVSNLNDRIRAWWLMCGAVIVALAAGDRWLIVLFALISFLAFREFITLTYTRRADQRTLFWSFFLVIPLQYILIDVQWYGFFSVFIPVYGTLLVAILGTLRGDYQHYLERTAKIQWGLIICVFCISHIPALLQMRIAGFEGRSINLVLFLLVVTEMSDVFQYVWGKLLGRHKVAPHISPNKTWEGLIGGTITAVGIGVGLTWMTPFTQWQSGVLALVIALMGFAGGVAMSAVKRDAGIKDFGDMLPGHGGILDRMDSLAFAAPIFFHVVRYYFAEN